MVSGMNITSTPEDTLAKDTISFDADASKTTFTAEPSALHAMMTFCKFGIPFDAKLES